MELVNRIEAISEFPRIFHKNLKYINHFNPSIKSHHIMLKVGFFNLKNLYKVFGMTVFLTNKRIFL
jgi:hypothetical protein